SNPGRPFFVNRLLFTLLRIMFAIKLPTLFEPGQFRPTLLPANLGRVRDLLEPSIPCTKHEITSNIIEPTHHPGFGPIRFTRSSRPDGCQRPGFAKTATVSLTRRIVVRMHHNRLRTISDVVALGPTPAGVLIVLGILHFLEKSAPAPDILAQSAANH